MVMNQTWKVVIVVFLIISVISVISIKRKDSAVGANESPVAFSLEQVGGEQVPAEYKPEQLTGKGIPTLIDLGADTCIPCKLMAPILEELKEELQGKVMVHFLNLDDYPSLAREYGITLMPTQIFYEASGRELFRHVGFYSKEQILEKWSEFGVDLSD